MRGVRKKIEPSARVASEGKARWCAGCGAAEGAVDIRALRKRQRAQVGVTDTAKVPARGGGGPPKNRAKPTVQSSWPAHSKGAAHTRHDPDDLETAHEARASTVAAVDTQDGDEKYMPEKIPSGADYAENADYSGEALPALRVMALASIICEHTRAQKRVLRGALGQ